MRRDCWERLRRPVGASRGWRQSSQLQTMTASLASLVQANVVGKFFFFILSFLRPLYHHLCCCCCNQKKKSLRAIYEFLYCTCNTCRKPCKTSYQTVITRWWTFPHRFCAFFATCYRCHFRAQKPLRSTFFFPHHFNSFSPITFSSRGYINTILKIDLLFQHVTAQTGGGNIGFFFKFSYL